MTALSRVSDVAQTTSLDGFSELSDWGVMKVAGADAASFLHGQLTHDFVLLNMAEARLAAFCNAKGRMQASFVGFKTSPEEVLLCCPTDVLAATLKRLSMFVLRAKAKLTDATNEYRVYGAAGSAVLPDLGANIWSKTEQEQTTWVRLPCAEGWARALIVQPVAAEPLPASLGHNLWRWLEVRSGVCMVTQPVFEAFVPQMLNYESVGGVNFKKGCYPGQEVVARSQFRGAIKRRAHVAAGNMTVQDVPVGTEVYHPADAEQPCGLVAAVAAHPDGGVNVVVSVQNNAVDGQALHVGSPSGGALSLLPLPYALLEDI
jgi:folate-binding protein YgfZ